MAFKMIWPVMYHESWIRCSRAANIDAKYWEAENPWNFVSREFAAIPELPVGRG